MAKFKPKDGNIKFKEATKNMSTKEKIDYIWEYYKWWILSPIAAVYLIFHTMSMDQQATHLHIAITPGFAHTSERLQFNDLDPVDEEVFEDSVLPNSPYGFMVDTEELSQALDHLLLDDEQRDNHTIIIQHMFINAETIPVFATLLGAGELDIVIAYQHDFDAMADVGHFRSIHDLDVNLPDHIYIYDHGILLRYLPIFNEYIQPNNTGIELILGVTTGSDRILEVENFFNSLFE